MRTRLAFEETRKEVVSLLEAGKEEFEKGVVERLPPHDQRNDRADPD